MVKIRVFKDSGVTTGVEGSGTSHVHSHTGTYSRHTLSFKVMCNNVFLGYHSCPK